MRHRRAAVAAAFVLAIVLASTASAHPKRGSADQLGRLAGKVENVELVGHAAPEGAGPDAFADVTAFGDSAYLASFGGADCVRGGVYVFDISDPRAPKPTGLIPTEEGSYVGEGVQILDMRGERFTGQVLIHNNEICGLGGRGGFSLWDVTDPRNPKALARHAGDIGIGAEQGPVHMTHSAFGWNDGGRSYVVAVDDEEMGTADIDIFEITDPAAPKLISETGLQDFPQALQPVPSLPETFFHDVVVEEFNGQMLMLASYWDAGWVILDVSDPAVPVFLRDTAYPRIEPFAGLPGWADDLAPGGNAHQAEFTRDGRLFIGTDEDMDAEVAPGFPFNGWGYVHLYDAQTMRELGQYAIAEALDPASVGRVSNLSAHEVAVDPAADRAYLSYYQGGLRVVEYGPEGLREVGAYVDPRLGNDFWGVQVHQIGGQPYILASDRATGLWIFRYTG